MISDANAEDLLVAAPNHAVTTREQRMTQIDGSLLEAIDEAAAQLAAAEETTGDADDLVYWLPTGIHLDASQTELQRQRIIDEHGRFVPKLRGPAPTLEQDTTIREALQKNSTESLQVFTVTPDTATSYRVQFPDWYVTLTFDDMLQLSHGLPLPGDHPLSRTLYHADRPTFLYDREQALVHAAEGDAVVFAIQGSYPAARIYTDPLTDETPGRVERLNSFLTSAPRDIAAIVDAGAFHVQSGNLIENLEPELEDAGIRVLESETADSGRNGRALIVISGHSSDELRAFIDYLGQRRVFQDNFVLFHSCQTPLTHAMIRDINLRYGAAATLAHEGRVSVSRLHQFLREFARLFTSRDFSDFGLILQSLLFKHGLNGIWTVYRHEHSKGGTVCHVYG